MGLCHGHSHEVFGFSGVVPAGKHMHEGAVLANIRRLKEAGMASRLTRCLLKLYFGIKAPGVFPGGDWILDLCTVCIHHQSIMSLTNPVMPIRPI